MIKSLRPSPLMSPALLTTKPLCSLALWPLMTKPSVLVPAMKVDRSTVLVLLALPNTS